MVLPNVVKLAERCVDMIASRGMGAISPSKMPKGAKKARRDNTDFTQYAEGGPIGLYANINAKKKRIAAGSKEKMRKPGSKGAPTADAFIQSAKTAKK
jgi:hypothetical protein